MQPLEALIQEEEFVIGAEIEGQRLASKSGLPPSHLSDRIGLLQLLPYAVHQPYFNMIVVRGHQLRMQGAGSKIREGGLQDKVEFVTNALWFTQRSEYQDMQQAIRSIKEKYKIDITEQDVNAYLLGFAGRILDYVKSNAALQQVLSETPTFDERMKNSKPHEIVVQLREPTARVAYYTEQIQRFYDKGINRSPELNNP